MKIRSAMSSAAPLLIAQSCVALLLFAASAQAQMSMMPPACAELKGDALDKCVRDIAVPQLVLKVEPAEPPPPDIRDLADCTRTLQADRDFCIGRNEIILACSNKAKHPDFQACFAKFIPNVALPVAANCAREKAELRNACAARNGIYAKCLAEPLGYFLCLANKGQLPEKLVRP
jgi:hypothetical protein